MKKGFTLVELLGVIVILTVIGVIAVPTVLNMYRGSKEELSDLTEQVLITSTKAYVNDNENDFPVNNGNVYCVSLKRVVSENYLKTPVIDSNTGEEIDLDKIVQVKVTNGTYDISLNDSCVIYVNEPFTMTAPDGVINEHGWAKEDFNVSVSGDGLTAYKYCISDKMCKPNTTVNASSGLIPINTEGIHYLCAHGINAEGNTDVQCNVYRLDKTDPVIGSIALSGTEGLNGYYVSNVYVSNTPSTDALSGILTDVLSPNAGNVTTDTEGTIYTLTATDKAGNTSSTSYTLKIDKTVPSNGTVVFEGTKGENDWYISDVTVKLNNTSEYTMTSNVSSITSDTKGTTVTVKTIDKAGNENPKDYVIKVDKTKPVIGTFNIVGTLGDNGWYTSDLTISAIDGSDATSGHVSSTVDITSITSNTDGTAVTLITKNGAGLTSTDTVTIKVDKDKPILIAKDGPFEIYKGDNVDSKTYFNTPTYSISGEESYTCTPSNTSSLAVGTRTVSCTATGGNGLTATASVDITINPKTHLATLTVVNGTGGSSQTIVEGEDGTWTVTANTGYTTDGATFSPVGCGTLNGNTVTISNVTSETTCTVEMPWAVLVFKERLLADNKTIKVRTNFDDPFTDVNIGTLYKATGNETETGDDVYYFAGNAQNNWVKFGTYTKNFNVYNSDCRPSSYMATEALCKSNLSTGCTCSAVKYASANDEIYWRIIRTNEDGGIRLLYVGPNPKTTTTGHIGMSYFSASSTGYSGGTGVNNTRYVGYMYGTAGSLTNNRRNTTNSTIKGVVDSWYSTYINTNYGKYVSKTAVYCNDRSGDNYNTTYTMDYAGTLRLKNADVVLPSYKCGNNEFREQYSDANVADKFTASTTTGNGKLTYPVALITADEVIYAGETGSWIMWNGNTATNTLVVDEDFWTMTPENYQGTDQFTANYTDAYGFRVRTSSGKEGKVYHTWIGADNTVRPVLSLKSCVKVTQGDGSVDNPYIVSIDDVCASAIN